ncbi:MAG TPA: thymidine phosphorylase family protein [Candidatus Limnocylindrales bacterium]|nr:thymidine phosphorylase family protein [Candidatus Limnocylindrales bacterium]
MGGISHTDRTRSLRLRRLGIDTYQEAVIYMHRDCYVCRSEGFEAQARVQVDHSNRSIIATLNVVTTDLLALDEVGLSEAAWRLLGAQEGDQVVLSHPAPVESLSHVRAKVYGKRLDRMAMKTIVYDIVAGRYSDVHLSAFITACSGDRLDHQEMIALTRAMIEAGERLDWGHTPVMDKHSVGGLPGNRTTLLVVPIIAACGLIIPKTSSRAITSPAGTADTMETLAPVNLDTAGIRRVVEREGGCIVWGGALRLSPADDILIRVERSLDLDSEGQLVASVLSKKAAAGSTHVVLDMPVGPTAKVRTSEAAKTLSNHLVEVGREVGLEVRVIFTDGSQPVGRRIGPALEARDVLSVLRGERDAPQDLRERALLLAGHILELSSRVPSGQGQKVAQEVLNNGRAWRKFQAICEAQGGMREPPCATHTHVVTAPYGGRIIGIDNRRLARIAKLAGAPDAPAAGLELHARLGSIIEKGQPLFTVHAETPGELAYALDYVKANPNIFHMEASV